MPLEHLLRMFESLRTDCMQLFTDNVQVLDRLRRQLRPSRIHLEISHRPASHLRSLPLHDDRLAGIPEMALGPKPARGCRDFPCCTSRASPRPSRGPASTRHHRGQPEDLRRRWRREHTLQRAFHWRQNPTLSANALGCLESNVSADWRMV